MAVTAPPRALDRRPPPGAPGRLVVVSALEPHDPGREDPPPKLPPRPPETGDGGDGGSEDDAGGAAPRPPLPLAIWVMVAAVALALPAGFLAAAFVHRGV